MEVCKVCRRAVTADNRAVLTAFGRPLLITHRHPCAKVVQGGVATVGRVALMATEHALKYRAPKVFMLLQGLRATVGRISDGEHKQ